MKRHPVMIASGVGLVFGLLCLLQAAGVFDWMPESVFYPLHAPALFLAGVFIQGEKVLGLVPVTIVVQWVLVGAVCGGIWHIVYGAKPSA